MLTIDLKQIVKDINSRRKHVQYSFQEIGLLLAKKLNDPRHKSLYMKLAKNEEKELLMDAMHYVTATHEQQGNVGALFMWKLKELKESLVETVNLRFSFSKDSYYIVGHIKHALRGELPIILAALREYQLKYPLEMQLKGKKLKFTHLHEEIDSLFREFKVKGVLELTTKWKWHGSTEKITVGLGEFMLDRPQIIQKKIEYKRYSE